MPVSVTSVAPVAAPQGAASQGATTPSLVLQPGTVVEAQVLNVLDANLVRIAIASLSVDVLTQVPLQAGTALKLAVSQTSDGGVRLAIVPPETPTTDSPPITAAISSGTTQATDTTAIASKPATATSPQLPVLTPLEASVVSIAAQKAAATQSGLSPLFADIATAVQTLPVPLQQAAAQLLDARTALTTGLDGSAIQSAFQNSGLFLESNLASGAPQPGITGAVPDLKAALLVFRQTLAMWLDSSSAPSTSQSVGPAPAVAVADATAHPQAILPEVVPLAPDQGTGKSPPGVSPLVVEESGLASAVAVLSETQAAPATTAFSLLKELENAVAMGRTEASLDVLNNVTTTEVPERANVPQNGGADTLPPPFRGAAPTAQPVVSSSIAAGDLPLETMHHLAQETDGAIARQTLLQIASLPDRSDSSSIGIDRTGPRWNFEIPFAAPQGTAVAQFEISRDGGGKTAEKIAPIWRARFSLDVEPAGPIHAMVSLSGEKTSVRMWAERPQTTQKLRERVGDLGRALRQAELAPGDIVIGEGAPPQLAAAAPPGHFLDRAT